MQYLVHERVLLRDVLHLLSALWTLSIIALWTRSMTSAHDPIRNRRLRP